MKAKYLLTLALLFTLVGCSQGNSLQDQVESLTGETQEVLAESERAEMFGYAVSGLLDDVKFFSYEEKVVVISVECSDVIEKYGDFKIYTKEEDIKFGYDMRYPLDGYDYSRKLFDAYNLQDVQIIVEITKDDVVVGYYDGEVWEKAR